MPWNKQNVVVPIDFSPDTARALTLAAELSAGAVRAIHVLVPLEAAAPEVMFGGVTNEERAQAVREKFANTLKTAGLPDMPIEIRVGANAGAEIAAYAGEIGADLIVIPTHGYHGAKRMALGSVTERVLRDADCDVLAVRRSDAD